MARKVEVEIDMETQDRGDTPLAADAAFDDLYRREWSGLVALGWSLTGRWMVAEELAQDAFADVYRRWDEVSRLDRTGDTAADRVGDPAFWAAVRALPDRQRACVALHYLEDQSVADIAEVLDLRPATVKVHLTSDRRPAGDPESVNVKSVAPPSLRRH